MSEAARLIATLRAEGVQLEPTISGKVRYSARHGVMTAERVEVLRRHRTAILAELYAERGYRTELAGGQLLLVHHEHRCACSRAFRCTAPSCAGRTIPCVVCRIERRGER